MKIEAKVEIFVIHLIHADTAKSSEYIGLAPTWNGVLKKVYDYTGKSVTQGEVTWHSETYGSAASKDRTQALTFHKETL